MPFWFQIFDQGLSISACCSAGAVSQAGFIFKYPTMIRSLFTTASHFGRSSGWSRPSGPIPGGLAVRSLFLSPILKPVTDAGSLPSDTTLVTFRSSTDVDLVGPTIVVDGLSGDGQAETVLTVASTVVVWAGLSMVGVIPEVPGDDAAAVSGAAIGGPLVDPCEPHAGTSNRQAAAPSRDRRIIT